MANSAPQPSRSNMLARAIILLEQISRQTDGIGVREVARQTGIDRSAVSRILSHFEEAGYVEQDGVRGLYVPGPRLFTMAALLRERDSLAKAATPFLQALVDRFNETCYLSTRVDDSLVYRAKVDCDHPIRYVLELGQPFYLVGGASGFAIMSTMSREEVDALLERPLPQYTTESFHIRDEVVRQLEVDRERGYSYNPGRWVPSGSGVAAPIYDATGRGVGAISLSAPMDRMQQLNIEEVGSAIRDAARGISERLGYIP